MGIFRPIWTIAVLAAFLRWGAPVHGGINLITDTRSTSVTSVFTNFNTNPATVTTTNIYNNPGPGDFGPYTASFSTTGSAFASVDTNQSSSFQNNHILAA